MPMHLAPKWSSYRYTVLRYVTKIFQKYIFIKILLKSLLVTTVGLGKSALPQAYPRFLSKNTVTYGMPNLNEKR